MSPSPSLSLSLTLPGPVTLEKQKQKQLAPPCRPRPIVPRRLRAPFFVLLIFATLAFLFHLDYFSYSDPNDLLVYLQGLPKPEGGTNPPRFYEWHEREKRLPQHDFALPYPQGREGRYIRFSNQLTGALPFVTVSVRQARHETQLADDRTQV